MGIAFGIAFVWFTTQFGGGFASGAQLKQYFLRFGIYCLFTCIGAQIFSGIYNMYIWYVAKKNGTYDYASFNKVLYGKYSPVFSTLYEIVYIVTFLVAPSVAFSTGAATMSELTNIPYIICSIVIGVFIFFVAVYGTNIVRRVSNCFINFNRCWSLGDFYPQYFYALA